MYTFVHRRMRRSQLGLTLVELMVALVLGLLIAAASVAALIVARQGFTSVDSSSQLRENARFATNLVQRIVMQAGFENNAAGQFTPWRRFCPNCDAATFGAFPGIRGYDNAVATNATLPIGLAHNSRPTLCSATDTSCLNGSDVLIVRYWGVSRGAVADGSMINCSGIAEPERAAPSYSVFHVMRDSNTGEPTLACSYQNVATAAWETVPLIPGVEAFQVLYGTDSVTPNTAPTTDDTGTDGVPERFLRASQIDVSSSADGTANNWRRVRSVRVGMVLRGPLNSAIDRAASGQTINVLGAGFTDAADTLSALTVPADGRLRQSVVFSLQLRNPQFVMPATLSP